MAAASSCLLVKEDATRGLTKHASDMDYLERSFVSDVRPNWAVASKAAKTVEVKLMATMMILIEGLKSGGSSCCSNE